MHDTNFVLRRITSYHEVVISNEVNFNGREVLERMKPVLVVVRVWHGEWKLDFEGSETNK